MAVQSINRPAFDNRASGSTRSGSASSSQPKGPQIQGPQIKGPQTNGPQTNGFGTISGQAPTYQESAGQDTLTTDEFLALVGRRVRSRRTSVGMSRKRLAAGSGVSERYLAQLEAGQGNMSIALLRKVAVAMDIPLEALIRDPAGLSATTGEDTVSAGADTAQSAAQDGNNRYGYQRYR